GPFRQREPSNRPPSLPQPQKCGGIDPDRGASEASARPPLLDQLREEQPSISHLHAREDSFPQRQMHDCLHREGRIAIAVDAEVGAAIAEAAIFVKLAKALRVARKRARNGVLLKSLHDFIEGAIEPNGNSMIDDQFEIS